MHNSPWATATLITAWFVLSVVLGAAGVFETPSGGYPAALLAAISLPLLVYLIDRRYLGRTLFRGIWSMSLTALVALQVWRAGGLFFLVEWWRGHLPGGFALPAGLGDIVVGLTAPLVAARIASKSGNWQRLFVAWNLAGLLDLVLAVASGVAHSQTPLGVLADGLHSDLVARYPLSVVPTFLVPLAVILHVTAFSVLKASPETRADNIADPSSRTMNQGTSRAPRMRLELRTSDHS